MAQPFLATERFALTKRTLPTLVAVLLASHGGGEPGGFLGVGVLPARSFQVVPEIGKGSDAAEHARVNFLQWNFHAECFLPCNGTGMAGHCDSAFPRCRDGATSLLQSLLESGEGGVDFAGLEQLVDEDFLERGLDSELWGRFTQTCGGEKGYGIYPFDSATLYYRKSRWEPKIVHGAPLRSGGCMEKVEGSAVPNYRAFTAQVFRHRRTGIEAIIAVSHHPHVHKYAKEIELLRGAIADLRNRTGIDRVVLIADTNQYKKSELVMADIYGDAGSVSSTELHDTCCYPVYNHHFDRIVAAGFPNSGPMVTLLPFGNETAHSPPLWVVLNMHDPVLGQLAIGKVEAESTPDHQRSGAVRLVGSVALASAALVAWVLSTATA